jgi:hypothetical protein
MNLYLPDLNSPKSVFGGVFPPIPDLSAACRPVPELFNVVIIKWTVPVGKFTANGLDFNNTYHFITQQKFQNLRHDRPNQNLL